MAQCKGRRWPHATPAFKVASYEVIGLLRLVPLSPFPLNQGYFKTVTSEPNACDVEKRNDIDTSLLLKRSLCPGKPSWFHELCLESQLMLASVETKEKCLKSLDATPFIPMGDIIITHTLEHSALGGGKLTEACDWTIFLLSREALSRPRLIWLEARQGGRHPWVLVTMRNYHLQHPFWVCLQGTNPEVQTLNSRDAVCLQLGGLSGGHSGVVQPNQVLREAASQLHHIYIDEIFWKKMCIILEKIIWDIVFISNLSRK